MSSDILVTVDLTEKASWEHALPQAVTLSQGSGGALHVLSVVPDLGTPLVSGFFPPDFRDKALAAAAKSLDRVVAETVPEGVAVHQHLAFGPVHERILETIDATGVGLVVMASHAPDPVREFLVGSQADRVVRRSPVSVLVVRA
jgi:nucleotide-binding universal stress UspA family protein